jgi:hypothetical protein
MFVRVVLVMCIMIVSFSWELFKCTRWLYALVGNASNFKSDDACFSSGYVCKICYKYINMYGSFRHTQHTDMQLFCSGVEQTFPESQQRFIFGLQHIEK